MISKKMYNNIKYFVKKNTIHTLLYKNKKIVKNIKYDKSHINPNKFIFYFLLFCGIIFIHHSYTLWCKYNLEKKTGHIRDIQIVPKSGIY